MRPPVIDDLPNQSLFQSDRLTRQRDQDILFTRRIGGNTASSHRMMLECFMVEWDGEIDGAVVMVGSLWGRKVAKCGSTVRPPAIRTCFHPQLMRQM